jgi:sugar phosphate isomerase/epimerase
VKKGGGMYKCFSSGLLGFGNRTLKDDIPLAVKYGYEGINFDINTESAVFPPSEFTELLAKNNLKNGGFGLPLEFRQSPQIYEAGLKALRPYCEFAQKTNTNRCITWLMPCSDTLDYKSNFKLHKERLTPVAKTLEEYGIRFGLEFVGPPSFRKGKAYEFIHDLDGLNELLDAIGTSNLGYLLDVFHWDTAGQVFDDFKKISGNEWIVMAHINDAPKGLSLEEQLDQKRELPGATGVLKVGEFMKGLQNLKYDGPVAVEPFSESLKAMAFEDAVKTAKTAMDKVWP